ncbi:methyltransferase domain-containing protein [Streptomyces sp. NPDC059629]|uniref:methyltransferase domain-containing protein n=1 Tax=Streptomyces sp. NPDC059629 TaxID=3346889 RepID=UPI003697C85B
MTAVDASALMVEHYPGSMKVKAAAEALPFADDSFDAALAAMTVRYWPDMHRGRRELCRIARRQVVSS